MRIPANVIDELVKGANSDIRQVLNMLSTFKLGKSEMDFDEGKNLYAFSRTSKDSLNDKMELYFHDFSFVPLFMQVS